MIQPFVQELQRFLRFRFRPPGQESYQTEIWCVQLFPLGVHVQCFRSIAPAVTKRALLAEDDDGQHVIVRAHM
jgi:hypothetical protein